MHLEGYGIEAGCNASFVLLLTGRVVFTLLYPFTLAVHRRFRPCREERNLTELLLAILQGAGKFLGIKLLREAADRLARRQAAQKAADGQDLVTQSSLHHLVRTELQKLAVAKLLPEGHQSEEFRTWLLQGHNVGLFSEVLICHAGGRPELARPAEERLAEAYENTTGETRKLAPGAVAYAASHVLGALKATADGKALTQALAFRTAAQQQALNDAQVAGSMPGGELARVRKMGEALLVSGRNSWGMPAQVAALTLVKREKQEEKEARKTSLSELAATVEAGGKVVVFGAGGVGKTTLLLDLGTKMLGTSARIPLFVDAAVWARSELSLLDYIASRPQAQANRVSSTALAQLATDGHLAILLNGWNEMANTAKLRCRADVIDLEASASALSFVVASRTASDSPSFQHAEHVEVVGLTWAEQSEVVKASLPESVAQTVLEVLAKDMHLRHAARSPLILRGLIEQGRKGPVDNCSVFDLLAAAVGAFENAQRRLVLSEVPIEGHHREYLEELACILTDRMLTECPKADAIRVIQSTAVKLAECQLIGPPPQPSSVMDVLVGHHLLQLDDENVRFAHQRFQEYFAAKRVLNECIARVAPGTLLRRVVGEPAWQESLMLVAEKLSEEEGPSLARARLVGSAAEVDVGLASDLAGVCGFADVDNTEVYQSIVQSVNALVGSALSEVHDFGVSCQIASALPEFAEQLWSLFESDDQQLRLTTHRLNGTSVSLHQLGPNAVARLATWASDRRAEFVHEIAKNPGNYNYIVDLTRSEADLHVRSAAITALFWNYPASDVPLEAWKVAPPKVQMDLLDYVKEARDEGEEDDEIHKYVAALAERDLSTGEQIKLANEFPDLVGTRGLDAIVNHLLTSTDRWHGAALAALVQAREPQRLLTVAQTLTLGGKTVPEWVPAVIGNAPADVKADIFERAVAALMTSDFKAINAAVLGQLADTSQTERLVGYWLQQVRDARGHGGRADYERQRNTEYILMEVPGANLLAAVVHFGQAGSYKDAASLLELLRRRIGGDVVGELPKNRWRPSADEVRALVAKFEPMVEVAEVRHELVRVHLCCISAQAAVTEFREFIIESCRRYLDVWAEYREKAAKFPGRIQGRANPYMGGQLAAAVAKCGFDAVPSLLEMMRHGSAVELVPEALASITSAPWADAKTERLGSDVLADAVEGTKRRRLGRKMRQPDDSLQPLTDQVAQVFGQRLDEVTAAYEAMRSSGTNWNAMEAEYAVGRWVGWVARIASPASVAPLQRALASGVMGLYSTLGALRGLVRMGIPVGEATIISQLELLHERAVAQEWFDQSSRYTAAQLTALILRAPPINLSRSLDYYLDHWVKLTNVSDVIHRLGAQGCENAWPSLLYLANKHFTSSVNKDSGLAPALAAALRPENLPELTVLIRTGRFFQWCDGEWSVGRLAPQIAEVLGPAPDKIGAFIEACKDAGSPLADILSGKVLAHLTATDHQRSTVLLEALDAGRALNANMPAFGLIQEMFVLRRAIDGDQYEMTPNACNELRAQLYARARGAMPIAGGCRRLLAALECRRRENGRPPDEPRHPAVEDGKVWTDVLAIAVV